MARCRAGGPGIPRGVELTSGCPPGRGLLPYSRKPDTPRGESVRQPRKALKGQYNFHRSPPSLETCAKSAECRRIISRFTESLPAGAAAKLTGLVRGSYSRSVHLSAGRARPHRLAWPRTPPFHGDNRGSNPLGDATAHGCFRIAISRSSTSLNLPFVICPAR